MMKATRGTIIPGFNSAGSPGATVNSNNGNKNLMVAANHSGTGILNGNQNGNGGFSSSSFNINADIPSQFAPAITPFSNRLFMAYRILNDSTHINVVESLDGSIWASMAPVLPSSVNSAAAPALTTFKNKLMVVYRGTPDTSIYTISSVDGRNWDSGFSQLPTGINTADTPAAVTYPESGEDHLYVAFRQEGTSNLALADLTQNSDSSWKKNNLFTPNMGTAGALSGPAMTIMNQTLYVIYQSTSGSGQSIYCMTSSLPVTPNSWAGPFQVGDSTLATNVRPALTNDGTNLYAVYTGTDGNLNYIKSTDGINWVNP